MVCLCNFWSNVTCSYSSADDHSFLAWLYLLPKVLPVCLCLYNTEFQVSPKTPDTSQHSRCIILFQYHMLCMQYLHCTSQSSSPYHPLTLLPSSSLSSSSSSTSSSVELSTVYKQCISLFHNL